MYNGSPVAGGKTAGGASLQRTTRPRHGLGWRGLVVPSAVRPSHPRRRRRRGYGGVWLYIERSGPGRTRLSIGRRRRCAPPHPTRPRFAGSRADAESRPPRQGGYAGPGRRNPLVSSCWTSAGRLAWWSADARVAAGSSTTPALSPASPERSLGGWAPVRGGAAVRVGSSQSLLRPPGGEAGGHLTGQARRKQHEKRDRQTVVAKPPTHEEGAQGWQVGSVNRNQDVGRRLGSASPGKLNRGGTAKGGI